MNNSYLIPANAKRGNLMFGYFRGVDLIIFISGIVGSILLLIIFSAYTSNIIYALMMLTPVFIAGLLVFPLPTHYHNGLVFLQSMYKYYSERQMYYWRGWCGNVQNRK